MTLATATKAFQHRAGRAAAARTATLDPALRLILNSRGGLSGVSCGPRASDAGTSRIPDPGLQHLQTRWSLRERLCSSAAQRISWGSRAIREFASLLNVVSRLIRSSRIPREALANSPILRVQGCVPSRGASGRSLRHASSIDALHESFLKFANPVKTSLAVSAWPSAGENAGPRKTRLNGRFSRWPKPLDGVLRHPREASRAFARNTERSALLICARGTQCAEEAGPDDKDSIGAVLFAQQIILTGEAGGFVGA